MILSSPNFFLSGVDVKTIFSFALLEVESNSPTKLNFSTENATKSFNPITAHLIYVLIYSESTLFYEKVFRRQDVFRELFSSPH